MANRWMGRVGFSTNSHREFFDVVGRGAGPAASTTWPNIPGGLYMTSTSGSGKSEIYLILPRYQFAARASTRSRTASTSPPTRGARGLREPYFATAESSDPLLPEKRVLLVDPEDNRLPAWRRSTSAPRRR